MFFFVLIDFIFQCKTFINWTRKLIYKYSENNDTTVTRTRIHTLKEISFRNYCLVRILPLFVVVRYGFSILWIWNNWNCNYFICKIQFNSIQKPYGFINCHRYVCLPHSLTLYEWKKILHTNMYILKHFPIQIKQCGIISIGKLFCVCVCVRAKELLDKLYHFCIEFWNMYLTLFEKKQLIFSFIYQFNWFIVNFVPSLCILLYDFFSKQQWEQCKGEDKNNGSHSNNNKAVQHCKNISKN